MKSGRYQIDFSVESVSVLQRHKLDAMLYDEDTVEYKLNCGC
jgi:hypothetical protein